MTKSVSISPGRQPTSNRPKWTTSAVLELYEWPFVDIVHKAQEIHRNHFKANAVQLSTLLSIKTGACPEDCAYCPQSAHYKTDVVVEKLLSTDEVIHAAREAKRHGASRFCMGAAWRAPKDKDLDEVIKAIERVKALGMETCATLGMLSREQAGRLKEAGLDYYNHNLDTSEAFYESIVTTRTYQDRLDTLHHVQACGLKVCCGGIIGMGEARKDRAAMIATLATLPTPPQSVPINMLVQTQGTPLDGVEKPDPFEFVKTIAAARITMPASYVRLSAGRHDMNDEMQALCFLAGANSIFYGEKLLTTGNASVEHDRSLLQRLGMTVESPSE